MTAWTIESEPYQMYDGGEGAINDGKGSDWLASLKSPDGIYVEVQIGFQANADRAKQIVQELIAQPLEG